MMVDNSEGFDTQELPELLDEIRPTAASAVQEAYAQADDEDFDDEEDDDWDDEDEDDEEDEEDDDFDDEDDDWEDDEDDEDEESASLADQEAREDTDDDQAAARYEQAQELAGASPDEDDEDESDVGDEGREDDDSQEELAELMTATEGDPLAAAQIIAAIEQACPPDIDDVFDEDDDGDAPAFQPEEAGAEDWEEREDVMITQVERVTRTEVETEVEGTTSDGRLSFVETTSVVETTVETALIDG